MKGKRLVDILEEDTLNIDFWREVFHKMSVLLDVMKTSKGNYNIDDPEIRWVEDRIEYWESSERLLTKDEMLMANVYWAKYHK